MAVWSRATEELFDVVIQKYVSLVVSLINQDVCGIECIYSTSGIADDLWLVMQSEMFKSTSSNTTLVLRQLMLFPDCLCCHCFDDFFLFAMSSFGFDCTFVAACVQIASNICMVRERLFSECF